jgi:hypothetical protein
LNLHFRFAVGSPAVILSEGGAFAAAVEGPRRTRFD